MLDDPRWSLIAYLAAGATETGNPFVTVFASITAMRSALFITCNVSRVSVNVVPSPAYSRKTSNCPQ